MAIRKASFVPGEFYHIYNRGNSKQIIFKDNKDYQHFISLLYLSNSTENFYFRNLPINFFKSRTGEQIVFIGSYCLMPNHFHIIISQNIDGGVSKFMQKVTTAYSMYFNKKYGRSGSLFEGRFKSKYIGDDIYFKYLFSYIHLNPIKLIQDNWKINGIHDKKQALKFLENYEYSSYLDYLGVERKENKILNKERFPEYFPNKENFTKEIFEWLSYNT